MVLEKAWKNTMEIYTLCFVFKQFANLNMAIESSLIYPAIRWWFSSSQCWVTRGWQFAVETMVFQSFPDECQGTHKIMGSKPAVSYLEYHHQPWLL